MSAAAPCGVADGAGRMIVTSPCSRRAFLRGSRLTGGFAGTVSPIGRRLGSASGSAAAATGATAAGAGESTLNTLGARVSWTSRGCDPLGVSGAISPSSARASLRRTITGVTASSAAAVGTAKKASAANRAALGGRGASRAPSFLNSVSDVIGRFSPKVVADHDVTTSLHSHRDAHPRAATCPRPAGAQQFCPAGRSRRRLPSACSIDRILITVRLASRRSWPSLRQEPAWN